MLLGWMCRISSATTVRFHSVFLACFLFQVKLSNTLWFHIRSANPRQGLARQVHCRSERERSEAPSATFLDTTFPPSTYTSSRARVRRGMLYVLILFFQVQHLDSLLIYCRYRDESPSEHQYGDTPLPPSARCRRFLDAAYTLRMLIGLVRQVHYR
ncbi:uncharacterized protein EDB91DRAFT_821272 [Suillus paluster]|uniref:uncharacterized protein n=1 Tax=Suillus paluster TaxID=48578 RepID=UPI001B87EE49|nr:uncharacterized protein EDB91DRAFT_821272 [Suillus paluster]KAG1748903.1 hypothetical protein EDB91DRAFT_821272 [Suillus paluster]